jgi:hypothetical protein
VSGSRSTFKGSSGPADNADMDNALDVRLDPRWWRRKVIVVVLLIAILAAAAVISLRPAPDEHATDPEMAGPPPGLSPIATGTLDGIAWRQFAWLTPGGSICLHFSAGATMTDCGRWNHDASPFAMVDGDSPITDGQQAASTTVIQGVLSPAVTSVRVVEPAGAHAVATLATCPCLAGMTYELPVFMLPLTSHQTAVASNGRYVVIAAFDNKTELGRVRIPVLNLGYCGRDKCK